MRKPSGIGLCPQSPHYDIVNPSGDNQNSREITKRLAKMISGDVVTNHSYAHAQYMRVVQNPMCVGH